MQIWREATKDEFDNWSEGIEDMFVMPVTVDYEAAFDFNQRRDVQYMDEGIEMVNLALGIGE